MNRLHAAPLARSPLSVCIAALLALPAQLALASPPVLNVTDCADPGIPEAATLRHVIAAAASGYIIELGTAPCSTITLETGGTSIYFTMPDLTIRNTGPTPITVDGSQLKSGDQGFNDSRVFTHTSNGTLTIDHVNVTGGHVYHTDVSAYGGCILTNGALVLTNSTVSACSAESKTSGDNPRNALGGAIYAAGDVTLTGSTITGSTVTSTTFLAGGGGINSHGHVQATDSVISNNTVHAALQGQGGGVQAFNGVTLSRSSVSGNAVHASAFGAYGGGIYCHAADIDISYSTIDNNSVYAPPSYGMGGGVFGQHNVSLVKTTISGNYSSGKSAGVGAFAFAYNNNTLTISSSTISGNTAQNTVGGVESNAHLTGIYNSTIAFNNAVQGSDGPGVALHASYRDMLVTLESNILSQNYYGAGTEVDLSVFTIQPYTVTINPTATHNIILVGPQTGLPAGTSTICPLLGPLRDNGGPTWTHALQSGSPAINNGSNMLVPFFQDQRGYDADPEPYPYPRISNGNPDVGAYEVNHADVLFDTGFDACAPLP